MTRKNFKDNTGIDKFFSSAGETTDKTHMPSETHDVSNVASMHSAAKEYRLNLRLKKEYKEYLERVSWENHQSVTQYLNDLIAADKATHDT